MRMNINQELVYLFTTYLLHTYYVLGIVLGTREWIVPEDSFWPSNTSPTHEALPS